MFHLCYNLKVLQIAPLNEDLSLDIKNHDLTMATPLYIMESID